MPLKAVLMSIFACGEQVLVVQGPMRERMNLPGLKSLRCFAALTIVLFHLAYLGKVQIPDYLWFVKTHFAVGVPLFYVVSAYSLMIGYHGKLGAAGGLSEYFIRRITRIAPLFYFMMIAYTAGLYGFFGRVVGVGEFMSSLFFVFGLVPQYAAGFVWASWSIGVEMVFYAVFPIMVLTVTSTRRAVILFLVALYLSIMWHYGVRGVPADIKPFTNHFILAYISYFATGILSFFLWQHLRDHARSGLIGVALLTAGSIGAVLVIGYSSVLVNWTGGAPVTLYLWPPVLAATTIGISLAPVRMIVSAPTVALGVGPESYSF